MKLAFSNIAWSPHDSPEVFALLRERGFTGIEVAPTKVWPGWAGADVQAARSYRRRLADEGFAVPALQAVLFGKPDAQLFGDGQAAFVSHLEEVAALAEALGAKAVVLGAPKQRRLGQQTTAEALERATPVFHRLGQVYAEHGTCLCIEPNPSRYGCDFIIHAEEGADLVRRVNSSGFGLHLDAAGMFLEGDDLATVWPAVGGVVRHFHVSEPDLGDFREPRVPHATNLAFLESHGFGGWLSVEMREPAEPLAAVGPWAVLGPGWR